MDETSRQVNESKSIVEQEGPIDVFTTGRQGFQYLYLSVPILTDLAHQLSETASGKQSPSSPFVVI